MSDGGGAGVGQVHNAFIRWIRANDPTSPLVIIGGDVYDDGTTEEFELLFEQLDRNVQAVCEVAGNHDWDTRSRSTSTGEIPSSYEAFWLRFPPPKSRQPIDRTRRGGARYDHFVDIEGWRFICVDTGPCKDEPWPAGDASRIVWLRQALSTAGGRATIVCAHHSRLSRGKHGDIKNVDALWRALFDDAGRPLASMTIAGHDHNVSLYGPRPMDRPDRGSVGFVDGIHVVVNGAGGRGHDLPFVGTKADLFDDADNYCLSRIKLIDARSADVEILSFGGKKKPLEGRQPEPLATLRIRV